MKYKIAVIDKPINQAVEEIMTKDNYVSLDQIDDDFENAIVTIEDIRYYDRFGIDFISIARAFAVGVFTGEFSEGGSTITQQLAKNIYFDFDRSWLRKFAEIFMTYDFESNYTKDKILELYVNYIYYGDGYYGINDAALGYFGKNAQDLNLAEASLLAGLPQAPSDYQLSDGFDLAKQRQIQVLNRMLDEDVINQQ